MTVAIAMAAKRDVRLSIRNFLEVVFKDAVREFSKLRPINGRSHQNNWELVIFLFRLSLGCKKDLKVSRATAYCTAKVANSNWVKCCIPTFAGILFETYSTT
jgi:hypothetical protein